MNNRDRKIRLKKDAQRKRKLTALRRKSEKRRLKEEAVREKNKKKIEKEKLKEETLKKKNERKIEKRKWKEAKIEQSKLTKKERKIIFKRIRKLIYIAILSGEVGYIGYQYGTKWGTEFANEIEVMIENNEKEDKEKFGEEYYDRLHPNPVEEKKDIEDDGR